jgi:adenine/guanine phosphoribosyltransferase-like PRPP-binding protein
VNGGTGTAPRRVFEHRRLWQLTPAAYEVGIRILTDAARARLGHIGTVIGIANGGRAPAEAIAALADAPVVIVSARHNATSAAYTQATGQVRCETASFTPLAEQQEPFLVIDDICGTGATFAAVTDTLARLAEPQAAICTVTLCRNHGARPGTPDLHLWDVADWVVFPWEPQPPGLRPTPLPLPTKAYGS